MLAPVALQRLAVLCLGQLAPLGPEALAAETHLDQPARDDVAKPVAAPAAHRRDHDLAGGVILDDRLDGGPVDHAAAPAAVREDYDRGSAQPAAEEPAKPAPVGKHRKPRTGVPDPAERRANGGASGVTFLGCRRHRLVSSSASASGSHPRAIACMPLKKIASIVAYSSSSSSGSIRLSSRNPSAMKSVIAATSSIGTGGSAGKSADHRR